MYDFCSAMISYEFIAFLRFLYFFHVFLTFLRCTCRRGQLIVEATQVHAGHSGLPGHSGHSGTLRPLRPRRDTQGHSGTVAWRLRRRSRDICKTINLRVFVHMLVLFHNRTMWGRCRLDNVGAMRCCKKHSKGTNYTKNNKTHKIYVNLRCCVDVLVCFHDTLMKIFRQ